MSSNHVHFLPIAISILIVICSFLPWLLACMYDHVEPILPYISDAGGTPPEAAIFSQSLHLMSFLLFAFAIIRYRNIINLHETTTTTISEQLLSSSILRLSRKSLVVELILLIGLSLVANFRMTEIIIPHALGAFTMLSFGIIDVYLNTIIAAKQQRKVISRVRLAIFLFVLINTWGVFGFGCWADIESGHKTLDSKWRLHWSRDEKGYLGHLLSVICEWLAFLTFTIYFMTFINEFREIKLSSKSMVFSGNKRNELNQSIHEASTSPLSLPTSYNDQNNTNVSLIDSSNNV